MTVRDLLNRMTRDEMLEWQALIMLENEEHARREANTRAEQKLREAEAKAKGRR